MIELGKIAVKHPIFYGYEENILNFALSVPLHYLH